MSLVKKIFLRERLCAITALPADDTTTLRCHHDTQHKTFSIMAFGTKGLYVTLSIIDAQNSNALHCSECCYAECRILLIVMLSMVKHSVIQENVSAPD